MIGTVWRGSRFHTLLRDGGYAKRSCQRRFSSGFGGLVDKILLQSHRKNGRAEGTGHGVQVQISERFLGVNSANTAAPLLGGQDEGIANSWEGAQGDNGGDKATLGTRVTHTSLGMETKDKSAAKPGLLPRCAPADPSFPGEVGTGEVSWKCLQFTWTLPSSLTGEEVADPVHNSCCFSSSSPAKPLSFLPARFLCSRT